MRGTNHLLALTTTTDEITGETRPGFAFPVQVCKATESDNSVSFDNAAPSGAGYVTQYVDEGTGEVFEWGDRLRGVKVGEEFAPIDPDAIAAIDDATKLPTMYALGHVAVGHALATYGDRICGVHYLQSPAKGGSPTAYRLTYEALKKSGEAIVTKRTARSRQKLGLVLADEKRECLVLVEIQFAANMRKPDDQVLAPLTAEVDGDKVKMAEQVIANLPDGEVVIENEVDEAIALRQDLIEKAVAGETITAPASADGGAATDDDALYAALEASIA